MNVHAEPTSLAARAAELCRTRACPNCGNSLTLWQAVAMVSGHGFSRHVKVRTEDGNEVVIPIDSVNPQTMDIIES